MQSKLTRHFLLCVVFLFLSFPLFYFVYKFGNPEPISHDFFQYYRLYLDWDIHNVIAPLNMRLVGAFFVHLFYKLNLYYDTDTAFDMYRGWGFLEQVYFNAVLFNWICVALTSLMIFKILREQDISGPISFMGGLVYLLGFGTLFYQLMPLTDACSTLLFAWAYRQYLRKNWSILMPLGLLVFQREYVLLAMLIIALVDWIKFRNGYFFKLTIVVFVLALAHIVLRITIFHNTPLSFQVDPGFLLKNLFQPDFNFPQFFKQQVLTLNLFWLYIGVIIYKLKLRMAVDRFEFLKILLLLLQVNLVSFAGALGTNVGRYYYLLAPLLVIQLVSESAVIFKTAALTTDQNS